MSFAPAERMGFAAPALRAADAQVDSAALLQGLLWPADQLADGIAELGRQAGLAPVDTDPSALPASVDFNDALEFDRYMRWLAAASGMSAEAVESPASSVAAMLRGTAPAVVRLWRDGEATFLFVLRAKGERLTVIAPDGGLRHCAVAAVQGALLTGHEAPLRHEIGNALSLLRLEPDAHEASLSAIARARLGAKPIGGVWSIGLAEQAPLAKRMRQAGVPWLALALLAAFAASYGIEIMGWRLMGGAILGGRSDFGWLIAWALLLVSAIPVRTLGSALNARLTVRASAIIKQRLLTGALALDISELRHKGAGQMLAQSMESQAFESVAVNGGLAAVVALIEVAIAAAILAAAPAGALLLTLLALWIALIGGLGYRYYRRLGQWSETRLGLTHEMVERMVGHRTVLAQEPARRREASTDMSLKQYHNASRRLDDAVMPFLASLPSGWSVAALTALAPGFIAGAMTPGGLAIALGGILFAGRAINTICGGIAGLARAAVAWQQAAPLFRAAARRRPAGRFIPAAALDGTAPGGQPVIEATGLSYSHSSTGPMILDDASLTIRAGDRMLLEGRSGGGKSTLASLLTGLRTPRSGLLLLNGLDRHTLGDAWHRIATEAPQFHENHIFSAPLAYNLLMGRRWPGSAEDLADAREVCEELGLGPLLERMPAGLMQMVGETGWQLSHGEKSRVFLARALLQGAALTILDESFAALDPETLQLCAACATKRSRTLVVIAHP